MVWKNLKKNFKFQINKKKIKTNLSLLGENEIDGDGGWTPGISLSK